MSRKKRDLSEEETALWRRVAASVKQRRAEKPALVKKHAPAEKAAPRVVVRSARVAEPPPPKPVAKKPAPPADRGAEKRVRRGKLEIGASLDLHGHTLENGRKSLIRFLHAAQRRGDSVVVVVTGKGRIGEGALKRALPGWLEASEIRPLVTGFAQAHASHGGAGAFYVFIRRRG